MSNHASSSRHDGTPIPSHPHDSSDLPFDLDPSLHTLHSLNNTEQDDTSRLNDFAQQALLHNEDPSFALQGDIGPLSGLLEATSHEYREEEDEEEFRVEDVEDGLNLEIQEEPVPAPPPRRRGGKRQRSNEDTEGDTQTKKASHKEVERRRRVNINDGFNAISQLLPACTDPKEGKSGMLQRAAEYFAEVLGKSSRAEEEIAMRDAEKAQLQREVEDLTTRLHDETNRLLRFETTWREAEDRAATSQFELESVKAELNELKESRGT